ncbi:putative F-box/FBD/LRR-repeat protein At3g49480 [Brassica rapa]|nr:putative F-box/FBD/LRR-repeat protein At3g49480 [Brassica rapa]
MRIQLDHYQCIQIDHHQYYNDTVLSKCVSYALDHCVRELAFSLPLYRTQILFLPPNVYTSKTLVTLTLAGIIIDVPSLLCLPSLQTLVLIFVVYKDQNSHVRLLANCPSLKNLDVERDSSDNVTRFNVKVPSLKSFTYLRNHIGGAGTSSLGLDSPGLRHLNFFDPFGDLGSIQNMPHLDIADVSQIVPHLNNDKLHVLALIKFKLDLRCFESDLKYSLEPLMLFFHNSPILKVLTISYDVALLAARISHFRGTNKVLYRDACFPILRSLCGKGLEEEEDKRERMCGVHTQNV